ncbi:zinc-ribbon domain-containing protein [Methanobrevibacter sp.]|uniref:zinc-ribbon domain-containing protein n=1 Tax=Methanobrevibacter sp. TaxID=66852 RepID=UPI003868600A
MGKIYCTECGTELDDSVKFCSNCGTALSDENNASKPTNNELINTNFNANEIISKIEILPIVIGCILTYIFYILGYAGVFGMSMSIDMLFPKGVAYSILFGSLIAGLLYKDSVIYAIIHGLIIAIIMEFFFLFTSYIAVGHDEFYFLCIIAGVFGSFIGNLIRTKIKN